MKKIIIFVVVMLVSQFSNAWDFSGCKITEVVIGGSQNAHIALNCGIKAPACATAGNYFAFDKSTKEGEQYLSMVMMAFSMDLPVTGLVDDNICPSFQPNVSLLEHIRVKK